MYDSNSINGDNIEGSLNRPTAVAIREPGKSVSVLDSSGIRIFDYRNEQFVALIKLYGNHRGLF